ncbi:hypothetical protein H7347_00300 [Corynebacterium sp. zg-331]|uniref:hypothetical protein n=1 Tax=unclassified Corynebacterium TaxID=2624378 RepID=UPI00128E5E16|nr:MULTISPECIES: hypothetical protein [unclassified Corynebacterium]MBC3185037.1 hypothetical protein [Corynebacterium sp. zg-331]MPV51537.1 hypothetical protein [Corynebacterium sp. zg331]
MNQDPDIEDAPTPETAPSAEPPVYDPNPIATQTIPVGEAYSETDYTAEEAYGHDPRIIAAELGVTQHLVSVWGRDLGGQAPHRMNFYI